jgi:hypothetical protein
MIATCARYRTGSVCTKEALFMGNVHNALATAIGMAITFLVSGVVWITLIAGLYQLVRDQIRRIHTVRPRSRALARESAR